MTRYLPIAALALTACSTISPQELRERPGAVDQIQTELSVSSAAESLEYWYQRCLSSYKAGQGNAPIARQSSGERETIERHYKHDLGTTTLMVTDIEPNNGGARVTTYARGPIMPVEYPAMWLAGHDRCP